MYAINFEHIGAKVLEYIKLNPVERRDYRKERGITTGDFFEGLRPVLVKDKDQLCPGEVQDVLGISRCMFIRKNKKGYWGERKNRMGVDASRVNQIIEEQANLISVSEFYHMLQSEMWYAGKERFRKEFGHLYESGLNGQTQYLNLKNSLKAMHWLRRRKDVVENWKTLYDLNRESGLNLSVVGVYRHYNPMIEIGELKVEVVGKYDSDGKKIGFERKIPLSEYKRVLEVEKRTVITNQVGVTTTQIASIMDLHRDTVGRWVKAAVDCGVVKPLKHTYSKNRGMYDNYLLDPQDADLFIERKLSGYRALIRTKQEEMFLSGNIDPNPIPHIHVVRRSVERKLWGRTAQGCNRSFDILLQLYGPFIFDGVMDSLTGVRPEDKRAVITYALHEAILQTDSRTVREDIVPMVLSIAKQRQKEEAASFMSGDKGWNNPDNGTLVGILNDEGAFSTLRKKNGRYIVPISESVFA